MQVEFLNARIKEEVDWDAYAEEYEFSDQSERFYATSNLERVKIENDQIETIDYAASDFCLNRRGVSAERKQQYDSQPFLDLEETLNRHFIKREDNRNIASSLDYVLNDHDYCVRSDNSKSEETLEKPNDKITKVCESFHNKSFGNHKCPACSFQTYQIGCLEGHMRSHLELMYMCKFCGFVVQKLVDLHSHLLSEHSNDWPYKCKRCERSFGIFNNLTMHEELCHGIECNDDLSLSTFKVRKTKLFLNKTNGRECSKITQLHGHKLYPYNSSVSTVSQMHKDLRLSLREFKCVVCDFQCKQLFRLKTHELLHSSMKSYDCKLCEFRGATIFHLKLHMCAHSDCTPYKCYICNYQCIRVGVLIKHIKTAHIQSPSMLCDAD